MTTMDTLKALQSEVGTRRDGTEGASQARSWLVAQCQTLGLPVELDEFAFVSSELYRPLLQIIFILLILVGFALSFSGQPLWGGVALFLAFFLFFRLRKELEFGWLVQQARMLSQGWIGRYPNM